MNASTMLSRQGHRLIQVGVALFLFSALEGFVIHSLPVPRLGLSAHTLWRWGSCGPGSTLEQPHPVSPSGS